MKSTQMRQRSIMRKNLSFMTLFLILLGCSTSSMAEFKEGTDYFAVDNPSPGKGDKVEVVEFFNYACAHCNNLEPYIQNWLSSKPDYIKFEHMPAFWNDLFKNTAKAFYTAEALGVLDKVHQPIFDAIHKDGANFMNQENIQSVFEAQGVKPEDFNKQFSSFYVNQKINISNKMFAGYKLRSVPVIVVDGQWRTSLQEAGSHEKLFQIVEFLSEKAKESRSK